MSTNRVFGQTWTGHSTPEVDSLTEPGGMNEHRKVPDSRIGQGSLPPRDAPTRKMPTKTPRQSMH